MKLVWQQKDFDDDIEFILFNQRNETPEWWKKQLFRAYPDLDYEYAKSLSETKRFEYITEQMGILAQKRQDIINNSIKMFKKAWEQIADKLDTIYSSAFDNDCTDILNDMVAEVGLDPICPRNISDHSFHIYHHFETGYAMSTALHEITHFVWFYFWQKHFKDTPDEYDYPHLKWLLSEIVVETIIRKSKINDLVEQPKWIAYSYFYDMTINGERIFDTMKKLYLNRKDIYEFMEKSFDWIQKNEVELREKISIAEKN